MVLFNLCGGPGAGKTTASFYLAYRLKKAGYRTELVGEAARELIYSHDPDSVAPPLLDNQILLAGLQYERILRLKRHGADVAISDSPLIQGLLYCQSHPYYDALMQCVRDVEPGIMTYNIYIERNFPYDPESRTQKTEAEARSHDATVKSLVRFFWLEVKAGQERKIASRVLKLLSTLGHSRS
jgi:predicted ATPase